MIAQQAAKKGVEVAFTDLERLVDIPPFDFGVALYTLQFLRTQARQQLVYRLAKALCDRGAGFSQIEIVFKDLQFCGWLLIR